MRSCLCHHYVWLFFSLYYLYYAEVIEELPQSNLQHPKHQPQDSDVSDILNKLEQDENPSRAANIESPDSATPVDTEKENTPEFNVEDKHQSGASEAVETSNGGSLIDGAIEKIDDSAANKVALETKTPDATELKEDHKIEIKDEVRSDSSETQKLETDDAHEETPLASFSEFREQIEKEKETKKDEKRKTEDVVDSVVEKPKTKLIQKNYADNSCGSKIVDNKKEFKNCGTILNNNKDLYAMIPCEGPIWFVVELCDTIQINAIQLANYELFSSSIKEFKVYTAETYPPKEWKHLGTFETVNNRQIQKFDIENHDYSKYVKFEKISSRGKEHFCVLSTFEVLGMSMVDEYEEVQHQQDEEIDTYEQPLDADDMPDSEPTDKSLIQGAKDTVKNIVDSALNVLGVSKNEEIAKNDTVVSKEDIDVSVSTPEKEVVQPTEESFIVKVDEMGKEIKSEGGPEKRLKGEEDVDVSVQDTSIQDPAPGTPEREAIMEAVDLSKDDDDKYIASPVSPSEVERLEVKKSESTKGMSDVESAQIQTSTSDVLGEVVESKPQEKVEKVLESPEPKSDGLSQEKGVIMTNSPKKNSIFVELDKKIKDVEKNLSVSNQYLETLSSRYKIVDQSYKSLKKSVNETNKDQQMRLMLLIDIIESRLDTFEKSLNICLQHIDDSKTKSNTLINTTNLILFLLLILLYFLWRMSYKVNQISYCVLDRPRESKATFVVDDSNHRNDSNQSRKRQRSKLPKDTGGFRSRDTSPKPGLVSLKSESNLPRKVANAIENKKPLESVQMDLIYPQQKSPTLKRRTKHVR